MGLRWRPRKCSLSTGRRSSGSRVFSAVHSYRIIQTERKQPTYQHRRSALESVLEYQVARWSHLDSELSAAIHNAVQMLSMDLLDEVKITLLPTPMNDRNTGFFMNGNFDNRRALEEVFTIVGVETPQAKPLGLPRKIEGFKNMGPASNGLAYLKPDILERVTSTCCFHYDKAYWKAIDTYEDSECGQCPCKGIGRLIHGVSSTALALTRCRLKSSGLRVQQSVISGEHMTAWSRGCLSIRREALGQDPKLMGTGTITHNEYFDHLGRLICSDYSDSWLDLDSLNSNSWPDPSIVVEDHVLGLSGGIQIIYYSCIKGNDAFDDLGRMIQISSGRISVEGEFRHVIRDNSVYPMGNRRMDNSERRFRMVNLARSLSPSSLAGGCVLGPHYRPTGLLLEMNVTVQERSIHVQPKISNDMMPVRLSYAGFMESIEVFLSRWAVPSCQHAKDAPYETQKDLEVAVDGFHMIGNLDEIQADVLVLALTGNKLQQLLACGAMRHILPAQSRGSALHMPVGNAEICGVLQISSCLKCCIRLSRQPNNSTGLSCVIMGG